MFEDSNSKTQPLKANTQFNNWNVIIEGWYCVGDVKEFKHNIFESQIGNQKLVIFRTDEGKVHCLDAFCSHMGLHLKLGTVVKDELRCHFHHWRFDGAGEATQSNCQKISQRNLTSYPTEVRYGLIWVWAGKRALYPLPFHQDISTEYEFKKGPLYFRPSHPHISLLNALDTQHVNTVHALDLHVTAQSFEAEDLSFIHYDFQGKFLTSSTAGKRNAMLTGGGYKFSVRYAGSTLGFLKALEGVKIMGLIKFPPIYATFGYRQISQDRTAIQAIFLTPKKKGLLGKVKNYFQLLLTELIYNRLKNEDGEIYENIRFTPHLTSEDSNIASFISHVNRLPKSEF